MVTEKFRTHTEHMAQTQTRTSSVWALLQNTSNKSWETRQNRSPTEKGLPLPKGRKIKSRLTSEKFLSWHCYHQSQGNKKNHWSEKEQAKGGGVLLATHPACGRSAPVWLQGPRVPSAGARFRLQGLPGGSTQPQHPVCPCQQHQHTHLHLGGHRVNLCGEEPRVLAPVVGSEVQNDPDAWNNGENRSHEKDSGAREKLEINKRKPADYLVYIMWHTCLDLNPALRSSRAAGTHCSGEG